MAPTTHRSRRPIAALLTFDDNLEDETVTVEIPEDLSTLSDEQLDELHDQAVDAFESLYDPEAEGAPDAEAVEAMRQLADGIDRVRGAQDERVQAAAQAREEAEALAARVRPAEDTDEDTDSDEDADADAAEASTDTDAEETDTDEDAPALEAVEAPEPEAPPAEQVPESVAASSGPTRVTVAGMRSRSRQRQPRDAEPTGLSLVAAADLGRGMGTRLTLSETADAFLTKMRSINPASLRRAAQDGKRSIQSFNIGSVEKTFPKELILDDKADADTVLAAAVDQSRLPGGSLVAASGWCSPSEVMYELAESAETTDGLFSLPEIQVDRGGLRHTLGPDFGSIYGNADLSWTFTEAEVEAGDYDGYGDGSKPCFTVECPEFVEDRLDVSGICIRAGLLQNRAYPETIERLVSGALVAHEFKQAGRKLDTIVAGSTAVAMPAGQLGALAPTLTAIEVQVIDYRQRHRIPDSRMLEAVFPRWVRGAIRSDLSRRLGVDMLSVSNEQIGGWFSQRGVNAQFVYELDDLAGEASARIGYPDDFKFLLYLAGTWIGGTQAVIDLEAVFDSALVERNIYTQLFTEEGWLVAKRFHDSRVVTVPICADGSTHGGVDIDCDGTLAG